MCPSGTDDAHQLHGDARRPRGPAAGGGRQQGAAGPREAEGGPDAPAKRVQDHAEGARGQPAGAPLRRRGKLPRRLRAGREPGDDEADGVRDRGAGARREGERDQDQRGARAVPAGRQPLVAPLLRAQRPAQDPPDVPVLAEGRSAADRSVKLRSLLQNFCGHFTNSRTDPLRCEL